MKISSKLWLGTAIFAVSSLTLSAQTGQTGQTGTPGSAGQSGTSGQSSTAGMRGTSAQSDTTAQPGAAGQMDKTKKGTGEQSGANRMGSSAHAWVTKAAEGGMMEVELGKLAQQQASSEEVKKFGQRMVDDHTKANDELSKIASSKGITLPTSLSAKHQATKDRLSKLSGAAFDRAYMEDMVRDHRADVADFRKESTSGQDAEVKAFAAKTLPTLEEHLRMAEQTEAAVKSSTKK